MATLWNISKSMIPSYFPAAVASELKPLPASAEDFQRELTSFKNLD